MTAAGGAAGMDRFKFPVASGCRRPGQRSSAAGWCPWALPPGRCCSPRPTREKTLVPLLFSVPMAAYHSAPLVMMTGILAQVSTLLITVGLPQRPGDGGIGRPGAGFADIAFHEGDERGFFTADEGAGALADLDVEAEGRTPGYCLPGNPSPGPGRWPGAGASRPGDIRGRT